MRRRDLLGVLAATVGGVVLSTRLLAEAEELEVTKTDEEWRRLLTPAQYQVLRHEATEPADSSPLLYEHRKGVFVCAGCELPLFTSETKFESGTGWPSFCRPIEGAVGMSCSNRTAFGRWKVIRRKGRFIPSPPNSEWTGNLNKRHIRGSTPFHSSRNTDSWRRSMKALTASSFCWSRERRK